MIQLKTKDKWWSIDYQIRLSGKISLSLQIIIIADLFIIIIILDCTKYIEYKQL